MNAWIDCLSYLRDDDGMTSVRLAENEILSIEIKGTESFKHRLPEIFDALVECTEFVNRRYLERQGPPALAIVFP